MKFISIFLFFASTVVAAKEWEAPQPYSVESIRAWQSSLGEWPWPYAPEQVVKLHGQTETQLLLAVSGGSRSGEYVLFVSRDERWVQASGGIPQAHHPIHALKNMNLGWHDFETFSPLWGSGGEEVLVSTYRWNGTQYTLLQQQSGKWCQHEPFRSDSNLCPSR
jgi:hypothetical protein